MECCNPHASEAPHPKEKKSPPVHLLAALIPIIAAGSVAFLVLRDTNASSQVSQEQQTRASKDRASDAQGPVTVEAQLDRSQSSEGKLVFTLALDTHSVDLSSFNLLDKVRLKTGKQELTGTLVGPQTEQSSHHQKFILAFAGVDSREVVLVIRNLGGVAERNLVFAL